MQQSKPIDEIVWQMIGDNNDEVPASNGDGAVMRWLANKAEPLITTIKDQKRLADVLDRYRWCRDGCRPYQGLTMRFTIGESQGVIKFAEALTGKYSVMIILEGMWIAENHVIPLPPEDIKDWINVGISKDIPQSLVASLIGRDIDDAITMPETLQQIITGRKIKSADQSETSTILRLDSPNW